MPMVLTYHEFKTAWLSQCKRAPVTVILFAFTCWPTTQTSKLITEVIENHSEFYVCANSCKKIASSRSW